ncbi:MAG: branched-chain amino acid ABC transporter permease [Pseudomonadota bacterium]
MSTVLQAPVIQTPSTQTGGVFRGFIPFAILLSGLAVAPLALSAYSTVLLVPVLAYGIALLGMNVLFGYTGLLSFGHAMFLAIGAYASAVATRQGILSFELILLIAAASGGLFSLLIGALCVRFTHIFFGVLTLAFGMLVHSFLFKFYDITGGDQGMRVLRPSLMGIEWDMSATQFLGGPFFYYCLALYALLGALTFRMVSSPLGLHLRAIRDNESKARYLGVQVYRLRLFAFVLSGMLGAIAGSILSISTGLADPELAYWPQSGNLIFMLILGGATTFAGPGVGALIFVILHEVLVSHTPYWRFMLGSTLILLVLLLPDGLLGTLSRRLNLNGSARRKLP